MESVIIKDLVEGGSVFAICQYWVMRLQLTIQLHYFIKIRNGRSAQFHQVGLECTCRRSGGSNCCVAMLREDTRNVEGWTGECVQGLILGLLYLDCF